MVLTRRAYREKMEISRWLPNEVLVQIIQHSAKADQATLARASKLFWDLCLPVLYRIVKLKNPRSITFFCSKIMEIPSRADAVRSFTLNVPFNKHDEIRCDLILASLKLMLSLDHLSLSAFALDTRHTVMLLEQCSFPQLISCDLWAPSDIKDLFQIPPPPLSKSSDLTAVFLTRHSTLKRIQFHSVYRMVASRSVHAPLPNLEFYAGHARFILSINAIGLQAVELVWYTEDDEVIDEIVTGISSMTRPNFPFVSSHSYWDDPCQIVTSVSKHIPHTKTLRLQCLELSFTILSQDTIRYITRCLHGFTGLVYLELGYTRNFPAPGVDDDSEDRIAVEAWGKACPTLEACCLNLSAWRKIDSHWETFSMKEFWVLAELPDSASRFGD
ncbi:hypothetical protein MSAN_01188800 [Mycena sanguinolenta]|uniref:F-box domain-containing protein n=1 Tax=Mycena sanguinolenta TaxID=230812 RepID=A0A8H6YMU6_9AGAR|nr:hypothetical protein MSAN_01188800 [Mycena sanguinolenta]